MLLQNTYGEVLPQVLHVLPASPYLHLNHNMSAYGGADHSRDSEALSGCASRDVFFYLQRHLFALQVESSRCSSQSHLLTFYGLAYS